MVVTDKRIRGSYPDLVASWTGARLTPLCYPGYTSACLRYELDYSYTMRQVDLDQLSNFTFGAYDKAWLDNHRGTFQNAVRYADLITLDIGVNDSWYSTIATIYEIAEYGYIVGSDPRGTLDQELAKYGSLTTVIRNAMYYLAGFAENPQLWAQFWSWWFDNIITYFTSYQANYDAIVKNIFRLNPNTTLVALGTCNSFKYLNLTPGTASGSYKITLNAGGPVKMELPFVGLVTLPDSIHLTTNPIALTSQTLYDICYEPIRKSFVKDYPGQYYYVEVPDAELIGNHFTIPMYEFSSLDDSGFNPHPTAAGHYYMATQIVSVLPDR